MSCEKDWIDILSALLTPTIAILGITIALLQWRLNALKYRHELYDRRLDVYKALRKLLNDAADADYETVMTIFDSLTESYFLFDKDISTYLEEVWDKTNKLAQINSKLEEGYGGLDDKRLELVLWFQDQYEVAKLKFQPYLQLGK